MSDWLLRAVAAMLLTYAVSRALRRLPIGGPEPRRSVIVHLLSALLVCPAVYLLRQSGGALVLPLVAQLGWCALDIGRGGTARGGAATARAG